MLPEIFMTAKFYPLEWKAMLDSIEQAPKDIDNRWAAFLMHAGLIYAKTVKNEKATYPHKELIALELAKGICARLKFSNARTDYILESVEKQRIKGLT
jgi:dihydroorotate dehydrogenase